MSTTFVNPSVSITPQAVETLRKLLDELRAKPPSARPEEWNLGQLMAFKAQVIPRYGPVFSPPNVANLSRKTFLEFLRFENNRHWQGLERPGAKITRDMNSLRAALAILVEREPPVEGPFGSAPPAWRSRDGPVSRSSRDHRNPACRLPGSLRRGE